MTQPPGADRFDFIRTLGSGGFATVELVSDRKRRQKFARKRIRGTDPRRIATLRRELRILAALDHPNIVRVIELDRDSDGYFLLIEFVEGCDIGTYCANDRLDRLAGTLPQLLSALRHLHENGVAHGDLKPHNVLVRTDGLLKLVDFGLSAFEDDGGAGGTPRYWAPEQLRGVRANPATDAWALGQLLERLCQEPTPEVLGRAIKRLACPDPAQRPSIAELQRLLVPALGASHAANSTRSTAPSTLAGRDGLLARLRGSQRASKRSIVVLTGPPGIGKTAIATHVVQLARSDGVHVVSARGRPEARLPFHVLEELLEGVLRLVDLSAPAVLVALDQLEASFQPAASVLQRDADATRVRRRVEERLFGARPRSTDPAPHLASLFSTCEPLLIHVEDLQWVDADSIELLLRLLDDCPALSLLATSRSTSSRLRHAELVPIPPLTETAVLEMLIARGYAEERAKTLARRAQGSPGLALLTPQLEAIRAGDIGEPADRFMLASLCVAGRGIPRSEFGALPLARLTQRGMLAEEHGLVDLAHDALRGPLSDALGPDWIRAVHSRRARDARPTDGDDAELVRHLAGAGRQDDARAAAERAAERLSRQGAVAMAAEMWDFAHRGASFDLRRAKARAIALERAQRYVEAANAWRELAESSKGDAAEADCLLRAAHALFSARRIRAGRASLDSALENLGERKLRHDPLQRAVIAARFLLGPVGVPSTSRSRLTASQAERLLHSAAIVGYLDTFAGLRLLLDLRRVFKRVGDHEHIAWCDYELALIAGFARLRRLSRRYRRAAERHTKKSHARLPVVRALPGALAAYDDLRDGKYHAATRGFDAALEVLEGESHLFETQLGMSLRTSSVLAQQDLIKAQAAVTRFEAFARDGLEIAIQCHVENARALVATWQGRFEDALAAHEVLRESWPQQPATVQAILIEAYAALPATLLGRAPSARRNLRLALDKHRSLAIFRTAYGPIVAAIGALTEVACRDADLRLARRWAAFAAGRPSMMQGLGERVLAYLDGTSLLEAARRAKARAQLIDAALAQLFHAELRSDFNALTSARARLSDVGASGRLVEEILVVRQAGNLREHPTPSYARACWSGVTTRTASVRATARQVLDHAGFARRA
ncbi:MAG: protein kinase [Polyangiaceae bacterium]